MEPWSWLDAASEADARTGLARCCGSMRWVERMLSRRPFGSRESLMTAARHEWRALGPDDWREAFACHPRIGDRDLQRGAPAATRDLSAREQAGVAGAPDAVLDALAAANREYERRFGYTFIVCATGRTAEEMLAILRTRLGNDPADEICIAAAEQERITAIRLEQGPAPG